MVSDKIYLGVYQVSASLLIALITMYISYSFLQKYLLQKHKLEVNNLAYAILASSILFSVSYLVAGTMQPIITTVKILQMSASGVELWKGILSYTALFIFIGLLTSYVINFCSVFLFTRLTRNIDELEEIKNNNLAVALITAAIITGISMILKDSMIYMVELMIPYPEVPVVY